MLKFNSYPKFPHFLMVFHLNTSYVKVQQKKCWKKLKIRQNLNTSYVKVQLTFTIITSVI